MEHVQIGPAGGNGGKPFDHYDIPDGARLSAIHIYTEWVVNAVQFDFVQAGGATGGRPPIGGLGGEHHTFYLDDDEYLTGISGRAGWYIDSLRLHTNKRVSPAYGGAGGERDFSFQAPAGFEIGGLFGRSAWYIDALGVTARKRHSGAATAGDDAPAQDDASAHEHDEPSWMELADEGQEVAASVVVRREVIASQADLDALEEAALAEVITVVEGEEGDEGTVDVAVYTQVVDDEATGETVAVVMAVAAEAGGGIEVVGDEPDEVAVMVTDAIESDDDIDALEEEAIEGAIDTLLDGAAGDVDEVDVTIYAGTSEDEASGRTYAAVVAIASRVAAGESAQPGPAARAPRPKDLELIEGIGPKIAALFIEHGILDLADLAAAPVEHLREILGAAGKRFRLADPGSWPEQARLGASGAWDALSELQARLKAGR